MDEFDFDDYETAQEFLLDMYDVEPADQLTIMPEDDDDYWFYKQRYS